MVRTGLPAPVASRWLLVCIVSLLIYVFICRFEKNCNYAAIYFGGAIDSDLSVSGILHALIRIQRLKHVDNHVGCCLTCGSSIESTTVIEGTCATDTVGNVEG